MKCRLIWSPMEITFSHACFIWNLPNLKSNHLVLTFSNQVRGTCTPQHSVTGQISKAERNCLSEHNPARSVSSNHSSLDLPLVTRPLCPRRVNCRVIARSGDGQHKKHDLFRHWVFQKNTQKKHALCTNFWIILVVWGGSMLGPKFVHNGCICMSN